MKLISIFIFASLMAIPLLANAEILKIANGTGGYISFRINNICSNEIDGFEPIQFSTIKLISPDGFNQECKSNPNNCVASLYRGNCIGLPLTLPSPAITA